MAQEVTLKLRAISDISDVTKNVQTLREYFKELKMPSDAFKGFDNTFTQLEKKVESVQSKLQSGFKTGAEINSFKRDLNDIKQLYTSLGRDVRSINIEEMFKGVDTPEMAQARENLKDFKKAFEDLQNLNTNKIKDAFQSLDKIGGLEKARKEVQELEKALSAGNLDQAAQRIREVAKAVNGMKEGPRSEAYKNLLDQLGIGTDETGKVITNLDAIKEKIRQTFNGDAIDNARNGIEATQTQIENLSAEQVEQLIQSFENLGLVIQNGANKELPQTNRALEDTADSSKQLNKELDQFKTRISYFFGMNNAVRLFQRAIRSAYETVKDLDKVMTETAVVTDFTVSDMWAQLPEYTVRANELGLAIHDVYEASTLYYQQGLKTNEVMAVTNATLRMARIAGLDAAEATDRVTNALRGFNMEITEANANNIADVYSKLAAMSASNVDEISTAMTKVASLANNANMEFETTAAFLSQIIETTRESAETAGTALKTVVARFSEVKKLYSEGELLGSDEEGQEIDVNKVSTALRTAGINLNEFLTGQRGLDEIFMELASKWDSLTIVQQRYIATMAAGSRQQSRFIALMSDYARTQELVAAAQDASGASQAQYEKTLDSLETKLNQLKNAWDEFVMGLAKDEAIKWVVDALTDLIGVINKITGGLPSILKTISRIGIAIGAFKGGGAIFNGLLKNVGSQIAKGMGKDLTTVGAEGAKLFAGGFQDTLKKLWPTMYNSDDVKNLIYNFEFDTNEAYNKALQAVASEDYTNIRRTLKGLTTDSKEAQEALKKLVQTNTAAFEAGLQRISTATTGIGVGLTLIGQILKSLGLEKAGKVLQTIGVGLTAIGIILPNLIKLGKALGLTFDFVGIHAAAGGSAATIAWGPFLAIVAAIVATVGLLTYAIIESSKTASERITESNKKVEEGLDRLQEKYNEINSTIEEITDKEDSFEELAQGTDEWRKSVEELNQQYLELIELMPALGQYLTFANGHLTIDWNNDEVRDIVEDQARANRDAQYTRTELNRSLAQANLSDVANNYLSTIFPYLKASDEATSFNMSTQDFDYLARARSGDVEAINYLQGRGLNVPTDRNDLAAWNQIADQLSEGMSGFTEEGWKILDEYMQETSTQRSLLQGYDTAQRQQLLASANVADNMQQAALRFMSQDWFNKTDIDEENMARRGYNNDEYKKWAQQWAESRGYTYLGVNNRGQITYTDENDKEQTTDAQASRREYAQYQEGQIRSQELQDFVNGIVGKDIPEIIQKAFTQTDLLTQNDVDELQKDFSDFTAMQQSAILEVFGDQETYEQYRDQILNEVNAAFSKGSDDIAGIELNLKNVTADAFRSAYQIIEQQLTESGYKTASDTASAINEIMSQLSTDSGSSFLSYLGSIQNWSKKNMPDVLREMSDLGIEFGNADDEIKLLISQLIELDRASSKINLEDFKATLSNSAELLKDLSGRSATDRTFTQDQYDKLLAISPELVNDMVWNGTDWSYIGGSLNSLEAAIRANTDAILGERIEALNEQIEIGERFSNFGEGANLSNGFTQMEVALDASSTGWLADAIRKNILRELEFDPAEFEELQGQVLADYFMAQYEKYFGTNGSVLAENITTRDTYEGQQKVAEILNSGQTMTSMQGQANIGLAGGENNEYAQAILAQAAAYGVAEQSLEEYNNLLEETGLKTEEDRKKAQDLLNTIAKSAALVKATKDMENYGKAISGNLKTLEDFEEGSREYNDALQSITEQTERYFDLELPDDFMSAENLQLLQEALDGSDQAWADFQENVNTSYASLHTWADGVTEDVSEIQAVTDAVANTQISIDGTADVSEIIRALDAAGVKAGDIGAYLDELGYAHIDFEGQGFDSIQDAVAGLTTNPKASLIATNVRTPGRNGFSTGAGGGGGSGGGGGGGGSKKSWKNPYDELYNLTEDINENLRERNHLEDEYGRIVDRNNKEVAAAYKNNLQARENLYQERRYRDQELAGRRNQLRNIGNRTVETEDGYKTYTEMDVVKYARYNDADNTVEIDWDGIDKIEDTEIGKAVEQYVKDLEELQGQIEDTEDRIIEIDDDLWELEQRGKEEALDMEKRLAEALKNQQQKVIDEYQALSETIDNTNSRILDGLQESIDLSRQIRDNTKTEEDIAQKEARLAYLRRDTSGANALEIQQLQKELDEARQSYSDTLIDQSIDRLSQDNQKAADQRAQQIDIMQSQLDYAEEIGEFNRQAEQMLIDAVMNEDFSEIEAILKADERFDAMSSFAQGQWTDEFRSAVVQAYEGAMNFLQLGSKPTLDMTLSQLGKGINSAIQQAGKSSGGSGSSGGLGSSGSPSGGGERTNPNTIRDNAYSQGSTYVGVEEQRKISAAAKEYQDALAEYARYIERLNQYNNLPEPQQGYVTPPTVVNYPNKAEIARKYGVSVSAFKTGGLADFTGPAWLDGTKSHPELVLNAKDTENFIALRNILSHLMNGQVGGAGASASGDINLDIDINVDQIGNDYDVDRLVDRVKQNIYQDASYRNINQINFIR